MQEQVGETALVEKHADMAEGLLPWMLILALGALVFAIIRWRDRGSREPHRIPRWLILAAAVVSLVGAVGATVQVARIGHSGAEATWNKASGAHLPGPDGVAAALLQPFQPLL